ncbi:hypothetical protein CLV47_102279 [Antricoccus suffuscus]|uniref:Winged helix-turn-helix protein n=2 Tax=Antricoccus suffuscus TaxID=1629062 RepID=A0A2T1A4R0_9ACTN|nr:hypothetical protein CLV47_102279 [Antricoccus suffuscus]
MAHTPARSDMSVPSVTMVVMAYRQSLGVSAPLVSPRRRDSISVRQARRVALAAQGFADRAPTSAVTRRHLKRLLDRVKVLQIDSVNVLSRAHYLPAFSRLGRYDRAVLDAMASPKRDVFEYWAHMASYSPVEHHPLLRWRMRRAEENAWGRLNAVQSRNPRILDEALEYVAEHGAITASVLAPDRPNKVPGEMWSWHDGKVALEYLFHSGEITAVRRNSQFERVYDLTARVIPQQILDVPTPDADDARRALVELAAQAHGIATATHLRDYFRLPAAGISEYIADLVEDGVLAPVTVKGVDGVWYLHRDARMPRAVPARALLSPFDSLIWERARTESLWDARYRIEIYVPKHKRVHGYYVLPFLINEQIAARVDLKADRQAGALVVQSAHLEQDCELPTSFVAAELWDELTLMAQWMGLGGVQVRPVGDLAQHLPA